MSKNPKQAIHYAIVKYGWDSFTKEIICCSTDREYTLKILEPLFINEYKTLTEGYNMTKGGDGMIGYHHSDETRKRLSDNHKGNIPWNKDKCDVYSEEMKKSMGRLNIGNKYRLGKEFTEETKQQISQSLIGNIPWNKGKKTGPNPEHSERMKGRIPWNKGLKYLTSPGI